MSESKCTCIVAQVCHLSTQEAEPGGLPRTWGQPGLYRISRPAWTTVKTLKIQKNSIAKVETKSISPSRFVWKAPWRRRRLWTSSQGLEWLKRIDQRSLSNTWYHNYCAHWAVDSCLKGAKSSQDLFSMLVWVSNSEVMFWGQCSSHYESCNQNTQKVFLSSTFKC